MHLPNDLHDIARRWGHHPVEAFVILGEGLRHASRHLERDGGSEDDRHLSAAELVQGIVEVMVERCGLLAMTVLRSWNIRSPDDLGAITFFLIEQGILGKQADDSREDFSRLPPLRMQVEVTFQAQLQAAVRQV